VTASIQEALGTSATLDDVFYASSNGRGSVCWDIGSANLHGLTPDGLSRALTATAEWLGSLDDAGKFALARLAPRVTVGITSWVIPVIPGQEAAVRDLMQAVLREPGSLGRMP
jgi:hypothetical protein